MIHNFNGGKIVLPDGREIIKLGRIELKDEHYQGHIVESDIPERLHRLFKELEEIVNDGSLMLIDKIDDQIKLYDLRVIPGNHPLIDIQVISNEIAFKIDG